MSDNRCICCGEIIPEGMLACPNCLVVSKKKEMKQEVKQELKPCPFCGETPTLERYTDLYNMVKYGIECRGSDCEIQPFTAWYADKAEAIEAWNRRAEDDNK